MPHPELDRDKLTIRKLGERTSKVDIERDQVPVTRKPLNLSKAGYAQVEKTAGRIRQARQEKRPVMLAFGAHTIKNCMAPALIALMEEGWVTHLATNGAGIIHDWEFAFQGRSSEDVRENVRNGQFGIWHETGFFINLALIVGAYEGLGYGESIGKMISREGLEIPGIPLLRETAGTLMETDPGLAAAALDLAGTIRKFSLPAGYMTIPHPFKTYSVQARAFELGIPFTGHPMIGHDIIYNHPMNNGAAVGRTALRDFLCFAESVSHLEHGVYLSVGSAVMSPMIFEKALSMAQNLSIHENRHIDHHYMLVVDLAEPGWDWQKDREPPAGHPAYYQRHCKTFRRMGGEMDYLSADNREFLLALYQELNSIQNPTTKSRHQNEQE
jgi:hypothetical protein